MTTKLKTTKKSIRNSYTRIISAGYCSIQSLLHYRQPFAYSAGINGWSCDYYDIDNVLISTGYSPLNAKNTKPLHYDFTQKWEQKAQAIIYDYDNGLTWEQKKEAVDELLSEFTKEVTEQ